MTALASEKENDIDFERNLFDFDESLLPLDLTTTEKSGTHGSRVVGYMALEELRKASEEVASLDCDSFPKRDSHRDTQHEEVQAFESPLTHMNVNTNGKKARLDLPTSTHDLLFENDQSAMRIKIFMGDKPLEASGLSVSGSGMQLYVKKHPVEEKLSPQVPAHDLKIKPFIKPKKSRKSAPKTINADRPRTNDIKSKRDTLDAVKRTRYTRENDKQNIGTEDETHGITPQDYQEGNLRCYLKKIKRNHDKSQNAIYSGKHLPALAVQNNHKQICDSFIKAGTKKKESHTCGNFSMCRDGPESETMTTESGSRRGWSRYSCDHSEQNKDQYHIRNEQITSDQSDPIPCQISYFKDFRSSDLPLLQPRGRHRRHNSSGRQYRTNDADYVKCIHPDHFPNHWKSIAYSQSFHVAEDQRYGPGDEYCDDSDAEGGEDMEFTSEKQVEDKMQRIELAATDKPGETLSNTDSSVGPQFDASQLNSQLMDAETLAKFTEYTQDMRKDLKRKYKDLSTLMREFNQAVREKNAAACSSKTETNTRQNMDKKCIVM